MGIIYMLLSISVIVAIIFFVAFVVSVRKGQYDDTFTPSVRMLFEDELVDETASLSTEISEDKSTNSNSKH